jgi:hypothetical protein
MTDGGAVFQPGQEEASVPFRPRTAFVAHEAFGHGAGAVLVNPDVARDLRRAAEFASQERRIAGGLLYGHHWTDDEGAYLVVVGFLETGPGANRGDRIAPDGRDAFALTATDLRLLREDADRMYSAAGEVGWWRTLEGPGEFGPRDFETQAALVGPGGAGLLVFGDGLDWGTAYLGPAGQVPGSARSFIPVPRPVPEPPRLPAPSLVPVSAAEPDAPPEPDADLEPEPDLDLEPGLEPELEPVAAAPGTALATRRPALTPAPQPAGPRVVSPVRVPSREWGTKPVNPSHVEVGPRMPTDVKIVVGALILTAIIAAIIIGLLVSDMLIAIIAGVVFLLGITGFLWMARR